MEPKTNIKMTAFDFLNLVQNGQKSFKNKDDFNEFLNLDLNVQDHFRRTPIMRIIYGDKEHYSLLAHQIMKICEKSDINLQDNLSWTYMNYILHFNQSEALNFNNQQISELINKANLTHLNETAKSYNSYFYNIMNCNDEESLGFSQEQLCELYDKTIQAFDKKQMKKEKEDFIKNVHINFPEFFAFYEKKQLIFNTTAKKSIIKNKI